MKYLLERILITVFILWGVCTLTFFLLHITPGDPVEIMLGQYGTSLDAENLRRELGLDQPLGQQYINFFKKVSHGDLGQSFLTKTPVTTEIATSLPNTFKLALSTMALTVFIGIPLGLFSAAKTNSWVDRCLTGFSLFGLSLPSFWFAPILIIIFGIKLGWLPINESTHPLSIVLPSLSLAIGLSSVVMRMTRASALEVIGEDYIRTARAKGLKEKTVFFKHVLKNALTPVITVLSLQFGAVLTGVVITETIFDWPGLGILLFNALQSRNYPIVQGCVLTIAIIYVLVNLITDFLYYLANPRMSLTQ